MSPTEQLAQSIAKAIDLTPITAKGNTKEGKAQLAARRNALAEIKWVMKVANSSVDVYCCLKGLDCDLTSDLAEAQVFDGRDNEAMKLQFWSTMIGEPLELVLL